MENNTLKISVKMHKDNRERLCSALRAKHPELAAGTFIVLQGGTEHCRYDTDGVLCAFRQVSVTVRIYVHCFMCNVVGTMS